MLKAHPQAREPDMEDLMQVMPACMRELAKSSHPPERSIFYRFAAGNGLPASALLKQDNMDTEALSKAYFFVNRAKDDKYTGDGCWKLQNTMNHLGGSMCPFARGRYRSATKACKSDQRKRARDEKVPDELRAPLQFSQQLFKRSRILIH